MRIALIWPGGFDLVTVLPLALAYLKSNLPPEHEIKTFDFTLNPINPDEFKTQLLDFDPQVVGISCWSNTYHAALDILETVKGINRNIVTVMGGIHATAYPEKTMANLCVDFLFKGEAEKSFPVFIRELAQKQPNWSKVAGLVYRNERGELVKNESQFISNLDEVTQPDYDFIHLQKYIHAGYKYTSRHKQNAPIRLTRGCPYPCAYCSTSLQSGKNIRAHSMPYMVQWIKHLYFEKGIRHINVIDDNFSFDVDLAKEFCKTIINLALKDLHFSTPGGIRIERSDPELFALMKKAGWSYVVVAPESGSLNTLKKMRKMLDLSILPGKVQEIKNAGLKVHGFFMVGYPGETLDDILDTQKLIRKCKFDLTFMFNFNPLPGTPIYDELVQKGEIEDGLMPKHFSTGERVYMPQDLKNFNFSKFWLMNHMYLMIRNPRSIFYVLTLITPKIVFERLLSNLKISLSSKASRA